jgi:hypothetical protein
MRWYQSTLEMPFFARLKNGHSGRPLLASWARRDDE